MLSIKKPVTCTLGHALMLDGLVFTNDTYVGLQIETLNLKVEYHSSTDNV